MSETLILEWKSEFLGIRGFKILIAFKHDF